VNEHGCLGSTDARKSGRVELMGTYKYAVLDRIINRINLSPAHNTTSLHTRTNNNQRHRHHHHHQSTCNSPSSPSQSSPLPRWPLRQLLRPISMSLWPPLRSLSTSRPVPPALFSKFAVARPSKNPSSAHATPNSANDGLTSRQSSKHPGISRCLWASVRKS
jgi:hypothetical protein